MNDEIQTGAILIAQGTHVPASIQTKEEVYVQGWQVARRLDRSGLIQSMRRAGWKLFSHDATFEIRVFGFDDNKTIRAAIRRIVATIRAQSFNCLEIKQVQTRRCLGFPYVLVSAHSWHIQEGPVANFESPKTPGSEEKVASSFLRQVGILRPSPSP